MIFFLGCCAFIVFAILAGLTIHEIAWRITRRGRKGWL